MEEVRPEMRIPKGVFTTMKKGIMWTVKFRFKNEISEILCLECGAIWS